MFELLECVSCRWLVSGGVSHGGINLKNPDSFSAPYFSFMSRNSPKEGTVLHIGLGAGEIPRYLGRFKGLRQTAVEISSEVLDLACNFNLPSDLEIIYMDGNDFVKSGCRLFDYVFLDTGANHSGGFYRNLAGVTKKRLMVNLFGGNPAVPINRLNRLFKIEIHGVGSNTVVACEVKV